MGFGSFWHWVILLVIVLLVMGPKRLPEIGASLGKGMRAFKKGLDGSMDDTDGDDDRREKLDAKDTRKKEDSSDKA